jgi:PAS domain S-box-containing protein
MLKGDAGQNIDYAAVVESAVESILLTTANLDSPGPSIVYVNPAFERMTGWSRAEIIGKSPRVLQGPETEDHIFSDMRNTLATRGMWEGCTVNYKKDGSKFWMEWTIVPLRDELDNVYQYLAIQRDVSARVEASDRLRSAQLEASVAERARANLARYFPPKIVDVLAATDQPLGEITERKLAVLFADIVDFTKLCETTEPKKVIGLLRDVHRWMEKVIFKWDGSIEGYIGDEVIAIFGFPEISETMATNALSCAFELLDTAQNWNQERTWKGLPDVQVRVGIQFGPVVIGDVGTEEFVEFTVIGDTVNVASRLQKATRDLQCDLVVGQDLVSASQLENEPNNFENLLNRMSKYGSYKIRGRDKQVEIWTLTL